MTLTERERDIVDLLRAEPLLDAAAIAERTGSTKAAVSVHLSNLTRKGAILGRGYVVRPEAHSVVEVRSSMAWLEWALMSMLAPPTTTTECASGRTT